MRSDKYKHAFAPYLIKQLDMMVQDPCSEDYMALREEMLYRMNQAEVKNPFKAGAPVKYEEDDETKAYELKRQGMTTRQIAEQIGCSQSTVVRLISKHYRKR